MRRGGVEYFVDDGEELCVAHAQNEIELGWIPGDVVEAGYLVRMPKAYPTYDELYETNVDVIRGWLAEAVGATPPHDVWSVNVEEDYDEEQRTPQFGPSGTGGDALVIPRR